MAPEVMGIFTLDDLKIAPPKDGRYSLVVDVWSLGVMAFQLLTNSLPFPNIRDLSSFVTLGMTSPAAGLLPFKLSKPCTDFVISSLAPSPLSRSAARELEAHAWLRTASDAGQNVTPPTITLAEALPVPTDIEQQFFLFDITDPSGEWDTVRPAPPKPPQFSPGGTTATSERLSTTTGKSTETQTLNTTIGDEEFDFDDLVVNSAAYRKAFAKQMKRVENVTESPKLLGTKSQEIVKKRSFRDLFKWRQNRPYSRDESIFNQPSPAIRGLVANGSGSNGHSSTPKGYVVLPGGRIARMSVLEEREAENESRSLDRLDPASTKGDASGPNPILPPTAAKPEPYVSLQSEQLPFFKDYYSQDDIYPGDRVSVVWAYQPRAADEHNLERGDMIKVIGVWDDGWATGIMVDERAEEWETRRQAQRDSAISGAPGKNRDTLPPVSGEIKAFPLVCVCLPEHWRRTIEGDASLETAAAAQPTNAT
jgi:serine/threonine protein kinase